MAPTNTTQPKVASNRLPQAVLIVTTAVNAWLLMQVIHELGHVIGGILTGG